MTIPLLPRVDFSGRDEPLEVCVVADLHFGAADHAAEVWARDRAYVLADPHRRVLLLGDLMQNDTKADKHGGVYESLNPNEQIRIACEQLGSIKDRIDVVVSGNHDERTFRQAGVDAVEQIVSRLGVADRYVRDAGVVQYAVGRAENSHGRDGSPRPLVYTVFAYHGDRVSQARTSLERAGNLVVCDAYVSGHTHDPLSFTDRLYLVHPQTDSLTFRDRTYLATGGYQRGEGYALRGTMRPRKLGLTRLYLHHRQRLVSAVL